MNIDLLTSCQNNCVFCYKKAVFGYKNLNDLKPIINSINDGEVYLGGQEPLNFPEIEKLVALLKEKNSQIEIIIKSSGCYNNNLGLDFLKKIKKVELPVYSHLEARHNMIMGNKEAWNSLESVIDLFNNNNLAEKLFFHTIALKENYMDIMDIYDFLFNKLNEFDYFKVIYPKSFIKKKVFNGIIVDQEVVIENLIRDFPPAILKEKIELINFRSSAKRHLFRGFY